MKRAVLLAVAAALAAMPAAAVDWEKLKKLGETAKDVKAAFGTPAEEEERQLGADVAATLLGASPTLANPEIQRYVNRVGLWVALQGTRPTLAWRFAVIDNPNVNAFATPGGYVFITKGLLDQLQTEAELAGVLGHEIAHVEKMHHLKAIKKDARLKLLGKGTTQVLKKNVDAEEMERLGKVGTVTKALYARGLDKADEFEADRVGVVLAARAGYDPYGLAQVLQTLDAVNADSTRFALLFKTHPKPSDRLAQLDTALGSKLDGIGSRPAVAERFVATVKKTPG